MKPRSLFKEQHQHLEQMLLALPSRCPRARQQAQMASLPLCTNLGLPSSQNTCAAAWHRVGEGHQTTEVQVWRHRSHCTGCSNTRVSGLNCQKKKKKKKITVIKRIRLLLNRTFWKVLSGWSRHSFLFFFIAKQIAGKFRDQTIIWCHQLEVQGASAQICLFGRVCACRLFTSWQHRAEQITRPFNDI